MKTIFGIIFFILLMIVSTLSYAGAVEAVGRTLTITITPEGVKKTLNEKGENIYHSITMTKECLDILEIKVLFRQVDQNIYVLQYAKMTEEESSEIREETLQYLDKAKNLCQQQKEDKARMLYQRRKEK